VLSRDLEKLGIVLGSLLIVGSCSEGRFPGTWWVDSTERIVAIGDLHGDLDATGAALRLAGAIDEDYDWIGGELIVVQTGDQLDRWDEDRAIIDLFDRLVEEASSVDGTVVSLNGNHELMNVDGWMDYVTAGGYAAFADLEGLDLDATWLAAYPEAERPRRAAFHPGGPYAQILAKRDIFVQIGETVFVHGGISMSDLEYGLDQLNQEIQDWMLGLNSLFDGATSGVNPVWSREYSQNTDETACANLNAVLEALSAERMVVGHTIQSERINPACDEKVWRIDVGMSSHYGGPVQILEIRGGEVRVLTEK
jgi:hypothetical protein